MSRYIEADTFDERVRIAVGFAEEELTDDFKDGVRCTLELLKTEPTIKIPQWIPCSEKLPEISKYEEGQNYLVTVLDKSFGTKQLRVEIRQGFIDGFWKGWHEKDLEILAWMPLPKPWKGKLKDGCN